MSKGKYIRLKLEITDREGRGHEHECLLSTTADTLEHPQTRKAVFRMLRNLWEAARLAARRPAQMVEGEHWLWLDSDDMLRHVGPFTPQDQIVKVYVNRGETVERVKEKVRQALEERNQR